MTYLKHFLYLTVFLFACCLPVLSQPSLQFSKEVHYFGQVEWKSPVVAEYAFTNTGNRPLVVSNITVSCGCMITDWTKSPVQPGEKGTVSITFDAKSLGRFDKSAAIYSNASTGLTYLKIKGEVVREVTNSPKIYSYTIGQIGIDKNEVRFPEVRRGECPLMKLNIANLSGKPYTPELMHLPPYLRMKINPGVLQAGESGVIKLSLEANKLPDLGLIRTSLYLSRFSGDAAGEENKIPFSVILLPDLPEPNEGSKAGAPVIDLSETEIVLDVYSGEKNKTSCEVVVANTGKSTLQIKKLQVTEPGVRVDMKRTEIQPGKSFKMKVSLRKKEVESRHIQVLIFTNDPKRPMAVIKIDTSL